MSPYLPRLSHLAAPVALVLASTMVGCQERPAPTPAPRAAASPRPTPAEARPREGRPPAAARPTVRPGSGQAQLPEAEVRALVDAWQAAQNQGDLQAYLALYASRFEGVKRIGLRTHRFDRKGWAADRGRMFAHPMQVQVADLAVAAHSRSAVVRFVQTWSSRGFQDRGPKQLVVVREGSALRIAREELLSSTVLSGPPSGEPGTADVSGGRFLMLVPQAKTLQVVLDHRPKTSWARPRVRELARSGMVLRELDESRLPAVLRAWKGKRLNLYGGGKHVCQVAITALALRAEVVPHFGTRQEWEGQVDGRRRTDAEVARAVWDLATGNNLQTMRGPGLWLVAQVDRSRSQCAGAAWAREASLPPPVLWQRREAAGVRAAALAKFRALPAWQRIQHEFRAEKKTGQWDSYDGAAPRVDVFAHPSDGRRVVVVGVRAGQGCGDFEGQLWVQWELAGRTWTMEGRPVTGYTFTPKEVFGAATAGPPQLLDDVRLVGQRGKIFGTLVRYEPPFYDCGC